MSTIVIQADQWVSAELRRATLKEARKTARGSATRVYIKVKHPKFPAVLMATIDGRYYR